MKIGFFASHRGSNMQAVLDACKSGRLTARPAVLITNNRGAGAVARAKRSGMAAVVLNATTYPDPDALDLAILHVLREHNCDIIVLAGFMKKINSRVLRAFQEKIINIHPALLPRHGGQGMYGMNVHRAVLSAGDRVTGVTVHLVDGDYDHGRVLAQTEVPVSLPILPETLGERVLKREHEFLVEVL